ncbi:MAG TPA: N-methyl-L-tryptophan oxidase [Chloroflexota bacterium]|nr:N-methyl-L-tryptophan oxidase [Chloroflexota bacterium]
MIVAGLGGMGSAAAYHLARRGWRVLGLEAFTLGHTLGSSHGESRIIRLSYFEHPDYVPLLRRAYELWDQLQREAGTELLRLTGGLYVGAEDSSLVAGSLRSAQEHRLAHEVLDASEIRRRFPVMRPQESDVALYEPLAGVVFPERCIEAHLRLAARAGADLRFEQPVRDWSVTRDGVEVVTNKARFQASRLVLTAGAWLGKVFGEVLLPLRVERNVVFWLEPRETPQLFASERFPIFIWDTGESGSYYGVPHLEWQGVKVARHHSGQYGDPDDIEREVSAQDEATVRQFVSPRIPALDGPVAKSMVCLYTNTPDEHFVVDVHSEHPSVIYAGGFSGHGFKFASVIGEVLADLALKGPTMPEATFLRAGRLAHRSATSPTAR